MVQVAEAGAPLQVRVVACLNPAIGVMVMAAVVVLPWVTAALVGERAMPKSGVGGAVTVKANADEVDAEKPLDPA
jgi:hypothetical protein